MCHLFTKLNDINIYLQKLGKYATVFHTASLDKECWEVAAEIFEEEPNVGAGVSQITFWLLQIIILCFCMSLFKNQVMISLDRQP